MKKKLSSMLQIELERSGASQEVFADWIGISKSTLVSYLSGNCNPRLDTLLLIVEKLGFRIEIVPGHELHPIAAMIDRNYQVLLMEISHQLEKMEQNSKSNSKPNS